MITKFRKRDIVGLGRLELERGEPYVAARTVYDSKIMPRPFVVIIDTDTNDIKYHFGPLSRAHAIKAVFEFNRIMSMRGGRW